MPDTPTPEREPLDLDVTVESVAAAIRLKSYVRMSIGEANDLAHIALRAIDLSGREKALRDEVERLRDQLRQLDRAEAEREHWKDRAEKLDAEILASEVRWAQTKDENERLRKRPRVWRQRDNDEPHDNLPTAVWDCDGWMWKVTEAGCWEFDSDGDVPAWKRDDWADLLKYAPLTEVPDA